MQNDRIIAEKQLLNTRIIIKKIYWNGRACYIKSESDTHINKQYIFKIMYCSFTWMRRVPKRNRDI